MDRQIVYPGQILPETSLLQMTKDAMIGSAKLAAAVLGTSTIANGFAVTPTGPASLQVVCAPGEIYSLTAIDALAFSSLPADTTHSIMKQGILLDSVTLSCAAPGTTGQSINYLVQATYQDTDSTPVLLPYYNSANPALPYSGMGNNGLTQNTIRKGSAVVAVKAGASAATGSQVTPAPDAGYVGLFVVTVAFGQTTITAGSITQYSGAPLLPAGLVQAVQSGKLTSATDIGTANAYSANFTPAITTLNEGLTVCIKAANANTGASTFTPAPGVISTAPVVGAANAALQGGEIVANGDVWLQWNTSVGGGSWVILDSTGGALQISPATKSQHAVQLSQAQALGVPVQSVSATVAANALTLGWVAQSLTFRNPSLTSGVPVSATPAASLSLVVPSGATLGTSNGVQATIVLLVAYNGGTPVLCAANMAGGFDLSETNLISPTTISAGATSATTIYSASAVSANSPYHVVGVTSLTQATAGTWVTPATFTQGVGGQAFSALHSFGYGQNWTDVTASRSFGVTYYNVSDRPKGVSAYANMATAATGLNFATNGNTIVSTTVPAGYSSGNVMMVQPRMPYSITATSSASSAKWYEGQ